MNQRTNEADVAAVTDVVRAYYDGSMEGDEAKLNRAFHPRACIVGNEHGDLVWATLDTYRAAGKAAGGGAGASAGATNGGSMPSRSRATPPWSGSGASTPACGTATTCRCSGST